MSTDAEGLHPIANTTAPAKEADIVFIHGLGGSSHGTWTYGNRSQGEYFFWPEELGKDLPNCGIWTVGYPAGFFGLGAPGMIVEKRAGNICQKLTNARIGSRPIIFVTHSMGGLIVKSLVVGSQVQADPDRKRIASATRGIVFCATPHRGSAFADAARILGLALAGAQDHVKEMSANADALDIMHDQFVNWQRKSNIPICSYAENIAIFKTRMFLRPLPLGLVVPRASANPNIGGHTVRDVDCDHLSLVKPPNREHDVYAGVLRFIRDSLSAQTGAASGEADISEDVQGPSKKVKADGGIDALRASYADLSASQKAVLAVVSRFDEGVHVTDLADHLGLKRAETVYRSRDLQNLGWIRILHQTDQCVEISKSVRAILTSHHVISEEFFRRKAPMGASQRGGEVDRS